jgi:hypothetical protein
MMVASFANSQELLAFALAWALLVILRRIEARKLWNEGERLFSAYTGYPFILMSLCPKFTELQAKNIEPVLCMGISYMMMDFHQVLGTLLMVSAICMGYVRVFDYQSNFRDAVAMSDAQVNSEQTRWRREGWDEY